MPIEADHEAVSPGRAAAGDGRGRLAERRASFLNYHVTMTHETRRVCAEATGISGTKELELLTPGPGSLDVASCMSRLVMIHEHVYSRFR